MKKGADDVGTIARRAIELHARVRLAILAGRTAAGDSGAVASLVEMLRDPDAGVREAVVDALGRLGAGAVAPLSATAADADPQVRAAVAEALGRTRHPAAFDALTARLFDVDWNVRLAAARALGRFGNPGAIDPLLRAMGDKDADVRFAAMESLGLLGDGRGAVGLAACLADERWMVRQAAAEALGRMGAAAAPALEILSVSAEADERPEVRRACRKALKQLRPILKRLPAELVSVPAPAGRGTEVEAASPPAGRGTEVESAEGEDAPAPGDRRRWPW